MRKLGVVLVFGALLLLGGWSNQASALDMALPGDFFDYEWEGDPAQCADGYIYAGIMAINRQDGTKFGYLSIFNNEGEVVWFKQASPNQVYGNFTPYPELGLMAYCIGPVNVGTNVALMDTNYTVVDTIRMPEDNPDGYYIDAHEYLVEPDTTYWLECRYDSVMDMSQYVDGGQEDAVVIGHAVLHVDREDNILWAWNSLDHLDALPFTELDTTRENIRGDEFEHTHLNSIEIDDDDNLILSFRSSSSVIKVDRDTGEVLWKLGGLGNQFTFVDDIADSMFSWQHDARRLDNGHLLIYDNGNQHATPTSYSKEFDLDEGNMTATLMWHYATDPPQFSPATGGNRRLDNGNTLIGWGNLTDIGATEVTPDGDVVWQIGYADTLGAHPFSYRYYRVDMLGAAADPYVVAAQMEVNSVELAMNWFGHEDEVASYNVYRSTSPEPADLLANVDAGHYTMNDMDMGTTYYFRIKAVDGDGSEISGWSNEYSITPYDISVEEQQYDVMPEGFAFEPNYPNPFNPSTTLALNLPERSDLTVSVFNVMGRQVAELAQGRFDAGRHTFEFDASHLASGVYFVQAAMDGGRHMQTLRVTLMK